MCRHLQEARTKGQIHLALRGDHAWCPAAAGRSTSIGFRLSSDFCSAGPRSLQVGRRTAPSGAYFSKSQPETKSKLVNELHRLHTPAAVFQRFRPPPVHLPGCDGANRVAEAGWTISLPETKSKLVNVFHQPHTLGLATQRFRPPTVPLRRGRRGKSGP